ncbi:MAG: PAS domain-containing protein [Candidatus Abyssobacteria bacterium SURF_5]|uniref:histidine kinase n=1 Tax=Abyssobacteria bacterium (strain SURF_5) TaxID=2093360 RepID=A0A3A4N2J0_ABYX5|nr:MAG: PAS domain-containing protein [Candidatus Abyssubacteria bacterium SURF_5]
MDKASKKTEIERLLDQVEVFSKVDFSDEQQLREVLPEMIERLKHTLEELAVAEEELRQQNEELRRAQDIITAQRREYQNLFDFAPSPYVVTDEAGIVLEANEAAKDALRLQDVPQIRVPLVNRVLAEERNYFLDRLKEMPAKGGVLEWEQTIAADEKYSFPGLFRAVLLEPAGKQMCRILWLVKDLTDQKRHQAERENARRFAEELFQTIREPLLVLTEDLKVMLANTSFYRFFRADQGSVEGRYVFELGNLQWDIPSLRNLLSEMVAGRDFFEDFQVEHTFPNIGRRVMLLNARRLQNENFGVILLLAIEDVTERIDSERRLDRLMRELKQSNEELQYFAYVASHDLQEPLRMITSYVQLIERRYGHLLEDDAREFMDYVVDGATRMKALIESLLEYSRVQTRGKEPEAVDAEEVLARVLQTLGSLIRENHATVTHDTLPVVVADPIQFSMVFQNLIDNAIRFRKEDEPLKVHISAKEAGNEWVFSVSDNGIGIEPRHYERIFRLYQRLHTRGEHTGTGIGLAICKRVVERHGGRIWVESIPGAGSTFFFTIPRREQ